jgi:uncharacterized protein YndB with AHSA1/START domain
MNSETPCRSTVETPSTFCVRRRFELPAERVFAAWLDSRFAGRWLFATASRPVPHVEIEPRVAGAFRFTDRRDGRIIEHTGRYLAIEPPRRLAFTLAMEHLPPVVTRVTVEVAPRRSGCELILTHANVPAEQVARTAARWTGILYGLGVTLASTADTAAHPWHTHPRLEERSTRKSRRCPAAVRSGGSRTPTQE